MGYSPWGCKESDATEATSHTHTQAPSQGKYIANSKCVIIDFIYNIQTLFLAWSSPFCLCVLLLPWLPNFQG